MNKPPAHAIHLRQQAPFRYVDEVMSIDPDTRSAQARVWSSHAAARYGNVGGMLPDFLVIEGLAQLSGVLMRALGLVAPGQVGYLVSVADGSPTRAGYACDLLLLNSRLALQVGSISQFDCRFTAGDGGSGCFRLGIGVQSAS